MKTEKPFLSIVVLCYNVENYLRECLESIRRQTFTDFEVIMVDDGSPDDCGIICDEYTKLDKRFKVIHKNNEGIIAARKDAINTAQGKYLGSVDGDDWIDLQMYDKMCAVASKFDADLVQTRNVIHYVDSIDTYGVKPSSEYYYYKRETLKKIFANDKNYKNFFIEVSLCRSLVRTERLKEIINTLDNDCSLCEDATCLYLYAKNIKDLCVVNSPDYHYRRRENSCTVDLKQRNPEKLYKLFSLIDQGLKGSDIYQPLIERAGLYFLRHLIITFIEYTKLSNDPVKTLTQYVYDYRFQKILNMFSREQIENHFGIKNARVFYIDKRTASQLLIFTEHGDIDFGRKKFK